MRLRGRMFDGPGPSQCAVLRGSLGLAALGLVLGLAGSVLATRVLGSLLFQVSPSDPLTLVAIGRGSDHCNRCVLGAGVSSGEE